MPGEPKNPVRARYWRVNGKQGYDLQVLTPGARVSDYIAAVEGLEPARLFRPYNPDGDCLGCDHCCGGRLPLTILDVYGLQQGLRDLTGKDLPLPKILEKYCQVHLVGRAVDITLRTDAEGYCLLLEPRRRRCRIYNHRPLICRTFFCSPLTRPARLLRERIVNTGEDELVRYWLARQKTTPPGIRPSDWQPTPFAGCHSYVEITLKALCPPELWRGLYNPDDY
ncbi:YkgJ family cysteine cluster protein [Neomoorella thermoacetica]|uniref:YkgJ family cysteine cluster protein n=1 Tax=Neomoorella thermoacetica TaxID=1525 RepID=UPI0008FB9A43|nr:YkgJ family cysteine cluster protein [Moorella thermoacetica]OIQ56419.1 flagellin N-methylase [Moorella thermoacetica]